MSADRRKGPGIEPRPRDLVDFHLRWSKFRDEAVAASADESLPIEARETIGWLIAMADRIGMRDIH